MIKLFTNIKPIIDLEHFLIESNRLKKHKITIELAIESDHYLEQLCSDIAHNYPKLKNKLAFELPEA